MPLESCMLILDNSEYMRNGDYAPTRFQAQAEAVQTVFTAKTDSNPESAVGLMTMAGKAPALLSTPTNDLGRLLSSLSKVLVAGSPQLSTAISIAQLALKHRENKNQRQRIVVFVGSPLDDSPDSLVKLGKRLRKNNVLIDVVTFGDEGRENDDKLRALVEAVGEESHIVSVPPSEKFLSDVILSSPILFDAENPMAGGAGAGGDGFGADDGIDPNLDPELAMAIRMSLAEAQAAGNPAASSSTAPAALAAPAAPSSAPIDLPPALSNPLSHPGDGDVTMAPGDSGALPGTPGQAAAATSAAAAGQAAISGTGGAQTGAELGPSAGEEEDEDEELRRAMALSRGEDVDMEEEDEDEDAAIARAIAMSMEEDKSGDSK
ncbi:hypothetical protein IAT38_005019 [Cryptococcus sp. DSM 104549]